LLVFFWWKTDRALQAKLGSMHTSPVPAAAEEKEFFLGSSLSEESAVMAPDETLIILDRKDLDRRKLNAAIPASSDHRSKKS
jgi:hypothetical protein